MDNATKTKLVKLLKADEGWSPTPYQDTEGVWTIGFGTNITRITREEGEMLLRLRLDKIIAYDLVQLHEIGNLNEARLIVYLSMLYNLGINRFKSFKKMRQAVKDENWVAARLEMLDSKWHRQVGKRAERLGEMMLTGDTNAWFRRVNE